MHSLFHPIYGDDPWTTLIGALIIAWMIAVIVFFWSEER